MCHWSTKRSASNVTALAQGSDARAIGGESSYSGTSALAVVGFAVLTAYSPAAVTAQGVTLAAPGSNVNASAGGSAGTLSVAVVGVVAGSVGGACNASVSSSVFAAQRSAVSATLGSGGTSRAAAVGVVSASGGAAYLTLANTVLVANSSRVSVISPDTNANAFAAVGTAAYGNTGQATVDTATLLATGLPTTIVNSGGQCASSLGVLACGAGVATSTVTRTALVADGNASSVLEGCTSSWYGGGVNVGVGAVATYVTGASVLVRDATLVAGTGAAVSSVAYGLSLSVAVGAWAHGNPLDVVPPGVASQVT